MINKKFKPGEIVYFESGGKQYLGTVVTREIARTMEKTVKSFKSLERIWCFFDDPEEVPRPSIGFLT
jgi:hypothetical protein